MGTSDRRYGKAGNIECLEKQRISMQRSVDAGKKIEERRRMGQFSTPYTLADEIVQYGLEMLEPDRIAFLEPAFGTGAFYSALQQNLSGTKKQVEKATGIEIDPEYFEAASMVWRDNSICIQKGDFTKSEPLGQYNLLITNPPYVRHHYLSRESKEALVNQVRTETGLEISGLAGLYCYFLLLAHKWLAPGAICGWLIPSEFMDVNYGAALKEYLLHKVHLLRIHRYEPEKVQFEGVLISSCVVWFKNEAIDCDYEVQLSYGGTQQKPNQSRQIRKTQLQAERKWTRFPQKCVRYDGENEITLENFFTIKRGVATGDNHFFILSKAQIAEMGLEQMLFKPVLPSPRNLKTDFIETDPEGLPVLKQQLFLLDCELSEEEIRCRYPGVWQYLQCGAETTGKKYLCKNRKKWYFQEKRKPTKFLCSYMGRGNDDAAPMRFILNLSNAVATNSYLMLYPKDNLQQAIAKDPDVVFQIWKSLQSITASELEDEGRIYGGGLKKIEPRELSRVRCDRLARLYYKIDG